MTVSRRIGWGLLVAALLALGIVAAGSRWASLSARTATDRAATTIARTHLGLLTSELQKFRLLPLVLAEYPGVARALAGGDAAAARRLDETLELLAARTDAAVLYAVDARGRAVAASNWRSPTSFVGQDYTFRSYFNEAMARRRPASWGRTIPSAAISTKRWRAASRRCSHSAASAAGPACISRAGSMPVAGRWG